MIAFNPFISLLRRLPLSGEGEGAAVAVHEPEDLLYGIEPLRVLISPFSNDPDGHVAQHIHDRLSGRLGINVRMAERPLNPPNADTREPVFLAMAVDLGRRWLKREKADLLIWGECVEAKPVRPGAPPGVSWRLRFIGPSTPLQAQGATMSAIERLEMPPLFGEDAGALVFGAALAAVNVESAEGLRARALLFAPILKAAAHFVEGDALMSVAEGATAQACYGALLLLDGARTGDVKTLEKAVAVYQGALFLGADAFAPHERAMIGAHIADALTVISDLADKPGLVEKTVEYYRTAVGMVRKEIFADDYASLKTRLGLALHGLAETAGDAQYLKEASDAFTAATSVWTITEAPERWADIQNSLGGLLITMGKLTKQPNLFDKAVGVFLKIAEARDRRKAPLVWATTLANIGAALKEKGMAAKNTECLKQAASALDRAGQVFTELNLEHNVRIVESERAQVLKLLGTRHA